MDYRSFAYGALGLLVVHVANAAIVYDSVDSGASSAVGYNGPQDGGSTTLIGNSFTSSTPDFSSISLLLSVGASDAGSFMIYLVPDNGSGGGNGLAGDPTISSGSPSYSFTSFTGAQLLGTYSDSSLTSTPSLLTIASVTSTITTANQEYWVVLAANAGSAAGPGSSVQWSYNSDNTDPGSTGQSFINNYAGGSLLPVAQDNAGGIYQMSVSTVDAPEPATIAILGGGIAGLGLFRRRRAEKKA
jgi:hypothetical protein